MTYSQLLFLKLVNQSKQYSWLIEKTDIQRESKVRSTKGPYRSKGVLWTRHPPRESIGPLGKDSLGD